MMLVEEEYFKKESERIFSESERCHLLNHRASEGSSREDILIKSLSNILPEKYGLCKGVVFNKTKKVSKLI
ncbi:hypothetical protein G9F72_019375 [Clostridium estertheticum]|uniref:DUF6602 domain-containing protein n=1 Tax=Clostridium estertheticum TaxID=238834 RepID=UPI0013E95CBD|nr:DUF6602 domain-containing protein [Clostridium estertheticum]MBZ9688494.1 hypothetical protein [Clostridium estertheticum]